MLFRSVTAAKDDKPSINIYLLAPSINFRRNVGGQACTNSRTSICIGVFDVCELVCVTRTAGALDGLTLNILDMSSEFLCCATSQSFAVMSILLQMSMSTFMAFSWILESSSDICYKRKERCLSVKERWSIRTAYAGQAGNAVSSESYT